MSIAIYEGASDVPAAGEYPARPQNKAPGKSSLQRRGRPAEVACTSQVEITTGHNCWEASDQRRDTKRHSKKWRFVLLGSDGIRNSGFKALRSYCGGSHRDYLRTFRGACTIKLAYQAADANHPGTGSEGSPLTRDIFGTQRRPIRPSSRGFYRTGITQGNAGETVPRGHGSVPSQVLSG